MAPLVGWPILSAGWIAVHGAAEPVQSQAIGERLNLPRRYLEQVMQQLVRAGILKGIRGPRGGYRLARERRRISVADIVRVVDEPVDGDASALTSSSALGRDVMDPFWTGLEKDFLAQLEEVTVDDLCAHVLPLKDTRAKGEKGADLDFSI